VSLWQKTDGRRSILFLTDIISVRSSDSRDQSDAFVLNAAAALYTKHNVTHLQLQLLHMRPAILKWCLKQQHIRVLPECNIQRHSGQRWESMWGSCSSHWKCSITECGSSHWWHE